MGLFGDCCRRVIGEYGIKHRAIAEAVRYDVSYVSKWVNSGILPAKTASTEICRSIALLAAERSAIEDGPQKTALRNKIYDELMRAYEEDTARAAERPARSVPAQAQGASVDRQEFVFNRLRDLRVSSDTCLLTIFADYARLPESEYVFLVDVLNYIRELDFVGGAVYVLLPEDGIANIESSVKLIALINLLMVRSRVSLYCYRASLTNVSLGMLGDTFHYTAQVWNHGHWLMENMSQDVEVTKRMVEQLNRNIMPVARMTAFDQPLVTDNAEEGKAFWTCHERVLMGKCDLAFADDATFGQVMSRLEDARLVEACTMRRESVRRALEAGEKVECLLYRQALDNLAYYGHAFTGDATGRAKLTVEERAALLRSMAGLERTYPNLGIRVLMRYPVPDIKHSFLPQVFLGPEGCFFLNFPVAGKLSYSSVIRHDSRNIFARSFDRLWSGDDMETAPLANVIGKYLGEASA